MIKKISSVLVCGTNIFLVILQCPVFFSKPVAFCVDGLEPLTNTENNAPITLSSAVHVETEIVHT